MFRFSGSRLIRCDWIWERWIRLRRALMGHRVIIALLMAGQIRESDGGDDCWLEVEAVLVSTE